MLACLFVAALAVAAPVRPTAGIVDNALVEPYEWAKGGDAAAWNAGAVKTP